MPNAPPVSTYYAENRYVVARIQTDEGLEGFGYTMLVGGALARAGHPVTLLVRPGRAEQYPERLSVQSKSLGSFEARVRVAEHLGEPSDVVWITVKATALEAALGAVPPEELGDCVVVPLLNGVDHVELLRGRYGAERVLPGTIRVEAERGGAGTG